MTDQIMLELSTKIAPAKKFRVDGQEYDLLGIDHLSEEDELTVVALFSRHSILVDQLMSERNVTKGKAIAEAVKSCRMSILAKLTTMPKAVAETLPMSAQLQLVEVIREEIAGEDLKDDLGDDGEEKETPGAGAGADEL